MEDCSFCNEEALHEVWVPTAWTEEWYGDSLGRVVGAVVVESEDYSVLLACSEHQQLVDQHWDTIDNLDNIAFDDWLSKQ